MYFKICCCCLFYYIFYCESISINSKLSLFCLTSRLQSYGEYRERQRISDVKIFGVLFEILYYFEYEYNPGQFIYAIFHGRERENEGDPYQLYLELVNLVESIYKFTEMLVFVGGKKAQLLQSRSSKNYHKNWKILNYTIIFED